MPDILILRLIDYFILVFVPWIGLACMLIRILLADRQSKLLSNANEFIDWFNH